MDGRLHGWIEVEQISLLLRLSVIAESMFSMFLRGFSRSHMHPVPLETVESGGVTSTFGLSISGDGVHLTGIHNGFHGQLLTVYVDFHLFVTTLCKCVLHRGRRQ